MWFNSRYMLLRLSMKIHVSVRSGLACSTAISNAYSYAQRIFGTLGNLATMLVCEGALNIPEPAMFM